jgi:plastocyanin
VVRLDIRRASILRSEGDGSIGREEGGRMLRTIARPALAGLAATAVGAGAILGLGGEGLLAHAADGAVTWQIGATGSTNVNAGDKVTWTWGDALPHSVTSQSGPVSFDSGTKTGAGTTFEFTFSQPGTYTYKCNVHAAMTGTVTVAAAAGGGVTTPAGTATTAPQAPSTGTGTAGAGGDQWSSVLAAAGAVVLLASAGTVALGRRGRNRRT